MKIGISCYPTYGGSGIVVQGGSSIVRCSATRNLPSGNGIQTGGGCHLADCTVANNGNDGITIFSGTTVRNCTAQSNGGTGITAMGGADGCQIIGNTCQANLGAGIHLASFSMRNVVDGNICNSNAAAGVAASSRQVSVIAVRVIVLPPLGSILVEVSRNARGQDSAATISWKLHTPLSPVCYNSTCPDQWTYE